MPPGKFSLLLYSRHVSWEVFSACVHACTCVINIQIHPHMFMKTHLHRSLLKKEENVVEIKEMTRKEIHTKLTQHPHGLVDCVKNDPLKFNRREW